MTLSLGLVVEEHIIQIWVEWLVEDLLCELWCVLKVANSLLCKLRGCVGLLILVEFLLIIKLVRIDWSTQVIGLIDILQGFLRLLEHLHLLSVQRVVSFHVKIIKVLRLDAEILIQELDFVGRSVAVEILLIHKILWKFFLKYFLF